MENLLFLATFTKEKTWAWKLCFAPKLLTATSHYQAVTILHRNNCFWYGAGLIKDYSRQTLHPGIKRHFNPLALPPPLTSLNSKRKMAAFRQLLKKVSFDQFSFYNIFRPMKRDKIKLIHFRKKNRKILSRRETNIVWKISKEFFCWYTGSPLWTTVTLFLVVRVGMYVRIMYVFNKMHYVWKNHDTFGYLFYNWSKQYCPTIVR